MWGSPRRRSNFLINNSFGQKTLHPFVASSAAKGKVFVKLAAAVITATARSFRWLEISDESFIKGLRFFNTGLLY
jgi:hypothetical protein